MNTNLINEKDLYGSLERLNLFQDDVVLIHGDDGIAGQFDSNVHPKKTEYFIGSLVSYFSKGTLLFPTFTYSSTSGEVYNSVYKKSKVGFFSEVL